MSFPINKVILCNFPSEIYNPQKKFKVEPHDPSDLISTFFNESNRIKNYYEFKEQKLRDYLTYCGHTFPLDNKVDDFFNYLRDCKFIKSLPTTLIVNHYGEPLLLYAFENLSLEHVYAIIQRAIELDELTMELIPIIYKRLNLFFHHEFGSYIIQTEGSSEDDNEFEDEDAYIQSKQTLEQIIQALEPWAKKWDKYYECYHNLHTAAKAIPDDVMDKSAKVFKYTILPDSKAPFAFRPSSFQYPQQRKEIKKQLSLFLQSVIQISNAQEVTHTSRYLVFKLKNMETSQYDKYRIYPEHICLNGKEISVEKYNPQNHPYFSKDWLANLLRGDKLEYIQTNVCTKEDDSFWNDWETKGNYEMSYTHFVRPLLKDVIMQIMASAEFKNLKDGFNPPIIMDICAGKGDLAKSILSEAAPIRYTLLEYNEESVKQARIKLKGSATVVRTDVVNDPHFYTDPEKTIPFDLNSVDIVVGSGAFTYAVLEGPEEGKKALANVTKYLKPGGFLVLSGRAASLLTSEDFEKAGYAVLNQLISNTLNDDKFQLYILKKIIASDRLC